MGVKKKFTLKDLDKVIKVTTKVNKAKAKAGPINEWFREKGRNRRIGEAISIDEGENWPKTRKWLAGIEKFPDEDILKYYGEMGVRQLYIYTPKKTGKTAASWSYEIEKKPGSITLYWTNNNIVWHNDEKVSVAVLIQNGHATPKGNWVEARDFMTPALTPVINELNKVLDEEARGK